MKIDSILEEAFLIGPDDHISHVVSRMSEARRYEAFVFDNQLRGIVSLDDIMKKTMSEPQKMKVSYFMKPVSIFSAETPAEDIINYMLVSEFRSLPVEKEGKIYAVTKPKLLKFVKDEVFEGKTARDVMQVPGCASVTDTAMNVLSAMRDSGATRMPVLEEGGKFAGLADSLSLSPLLTERARSRMGEKGGEKKKLGDVDITGFVTRDVATVGPDSDLKGIVKRVSDQGIHTVVVEDDGRFMGLVTLKDILKLIGKSMETVYIRLSGLSEEDEFVKKKIDDMIETTIGKLLKIVKINYVVIHVEEHKKKEKSELRKYSVQGRFVTDKGNFYASDHEWDPTKAMKLFLGKIETEVKRDTGKKRGY